MCHKKLTGLLLMMIVIIVSCRKHKEEGPKYYLVKEEYEHASGNPSYTYTYDADYRLSTISWTGATMSHAYVITVDVYDEKGRIAVLTRNNAASTDIKNIYRYDDQGRLSAIEFYNIMGGSSTVHTHDKVFTYSGPKTTIAYITFPGGVTTSKTEYIQNSDGNIIQSLHYGAAGALQGTVDYSSFDTKLHYATALPGEYYGEPISTHNPGFSTSTSGSAATTIVVYTYEYNTDGLPVKMTADAGLSHNVVKYTYTKR
jgi:hypothetical protein